jgi:hypothetical protein
MSLFSAKGGGQRHAPTAEDEISVGETEGPDVVVESGSYTIPRAAGQPFDLVKARIATRQEWVRAIVAVLFVALLGAIVLLAFHRAESWADTVELLDRVLPAVTGLLGSVIGFYFATRNGGSD